MAPKRKENEKTTLSFIIVACSTVVQCSKRSAPFIRSCSQNICPNVLSFVVKLIRKKSKKMVSMCLRGVWVISKDFNRMHFDGLRFVH